MLPYRWKAYTVFILLVFYPIYSDAVNFSQCLAEVTSCATNPTGRDCVFNLNISSATAFSILRTSEGTQVIPNTTDPNSTDTATALSLYGCRKYCGTGQEPFSWTVFSQEYSAWLLPYLALLSQLPFGGRRRTDNLMSAILTLGSPTLAGYSLYMTLLNTRWLNDQIFAGIDYPSAAVRQSVVQVLSSLQQVPLRIHPGESARFESLVVHPANDEWWSTLASELDYSHTWSIASATSITWVVVAYLLTVVDSLSNVADQINSNGEGTGSVWLWLLPIVVGWLVLSPRCDYDRVHDAYNKANRQVFVPDPRDPSAAPIPVTSNFGLTIGPSPDWKLSDRNITSPDESRIPPVFNYARVLSWSRTAYVISLFYRAASEKSNQRVGVDGKHIPENVRSDVSKECRLGNRDQTIQYCRPDDDEYPVWPRGVVFNMVVASLMALQLQWGTTSAAVLAVLYTPTIGLGCRSLAYLIYGMISTAVWILLVFSSALGYYAHHLINDSPTPDLESEGGQRTPSTPSRPPEPTLETGRKCNGSASSEGVAIPLHQIQAPQAPQVDTEEDTAPSTDLDGPASTATLKYVQTGQVYGQTIARVADWLRWIGKSFAVINAIGIVTNSVFQYAGVYDTCYCDSSYFHWGSAAFNIINPGQSDIDLARSAWIGGLALALTSCTFFVGTIYLVRDSVPS